MCVFNATSERKNEPGETLEVVEMWEEGGFTDQTRVLARLVTGDIDLCLHNLERSEWRPVPSRAAQIL